MESMSSNRRLTELGRARSIGVSTCQCFGRWEGHYEMIATVKGPKQASRVLVAQGFPPMPGD